MPTKIIANFIEVGNRLQELGTKREWLLDVAEAMAAASNECTENDPSGAHGWRSWQMGTRRNREIHCGQDGWIKDDTDQIPSILNEEIGIKIVVCNTDDGTCIQGREPQNRSRKGPATERLVESNQADLFPDEHIPHPDSVVVPFSEERRGPGILTYMLCVYQEQDELRVELSCVISASGGYFAKFDERIFIIGGDAGPADPIKRKDSDDDGSDFDIPVKRKK